MVIERLLREHVEAVYAAYRERSEHQDFGIALPGSAGKEGRPRQFLPDLEVPSKEVPTRFAKAPEAIEAFGLFERLARDRLSINAYALPSGLYLLRATDPGDASWLELYDAADGRLLGAGKAHLEVIGWCDRAWLRSNLSKMGEGYPPAMDPSTTLWGAQPLDPAPPDLRAGLTSPREGTRLASLRALAAHPPVPLPAAEVASLLTDRLRAVRRQAAITLGAFGQGAKAAVGDLRTVVKESPDLGARVEAARALAMITGRRQELGANLTMGLDVRQLKGALLGPDPEVQGLALEAALTAQLSPQELRSVAYSRLGAVFSTQAEARAAAASAAVAAARDQALLTALTLVERSKATHPEIVRLLEARATAARALRCDRPNPYEDSRRRAAVCDRFLGLFGPPSP